MPLGTPEDYEQAVAAEHDETIALDYEDRDKLDVHAAARNILAFADITEGQWDKVPGTVTHYHAEEVRDTPPDRPSPSKQKGRTVAKTIMVSFIALHIG